MNILFNLKQLLQNYPFIWLWLSCVRRWISVLRGKLRRDFLLAQAYVDVGQLLRSQTRYQLAVKYLEQAQHYQPTWEVPYAELAAAYRLSEQPEKAVACCQQLYRLLPDNYADEFVMEEFFSLGDTFYLAGDLQQALPWWQRAMKIQENLIRVHHPQQVGTRYLIGWSHIIGHLATLDFYIKADRLGLNPKYRHIVLAPPDAVVNECYLNYWRPHIEIISEPSDVAYHTAQSKFLANRFRLAPLNGEWRWIHDVLPLVQQQWELQGYPSLLMLTESDRERGWEVLEDFGISRTSWFVCFHVRESGFHHQWHESYAAIRNADIETYLKAIEAIISHGGWVIRMGDPSMKPLPPLPQVIDYAHSPFRSDWMDVFLCASCYFFVGTNSGLCWVPSTFGVPCVLTNWSPLGIQSWYSKDVMIPKLLWSVKENRYLTFSEQLRSPFLHTEDAVCLTSMGINIIDNSSEEILEVILEMLCRLEGSSKHSPEDEELQRAFQTHLQRSGVIGANRIGRYFLKKHSNLL